jgi:hypothetical protein
MLGSDGKFPSYKTESGWDSLSLPRLQAAVKSGIRWYDPKVLQSVWFSPARGIKGDWDYLKQAGVGVYIHYGAKEMFRDEILSLIEGLKRDDVDVMVREVGSD